MPAATIDMKLEFTFPNDITFPGMSSMGSVQKVDAFRTTC